MQAPCTARFQTRQALGNGRVIGRADSVVEVGDQVFRGSIDPTELGVGQTTVAALVPGLRQKDDEALHHGQEPAPIAAAAMDFFQVSQDARNHISGRR